MVEKFRLAPIIRVKAKDIVRAAGLTMLPKGNFHVDRDLKKIKTKTSLSPILLVRGNGSKDIRLTIADGYHRACAVYINNEDAYVEARIVDWN